MNSEVRIKVSADNDTKHGFDGARREAEGFGKDALRFGMSAGLSFGKNFGASLTTTISGAASSMGPILGGIGIAAAPLIASSLSGAIIGGAGIGGVVGGIMLAKNDPRVAGAIEDLGDDFKDRMESSASAFIDPTIKGVGIIKGALNSIDIEGIFAASSKYVVPLAEGVGRAITGLSDGLEDLVDNAGPVIDVIADGIGDIGEEIGEGLSSLSDNAESAADSLDTVFTALGHVTDITFGTINGLMEINEQLEKIGLEGTAGLNVINTLLDDGSGTLGHYRAEVDDATDSLTEFQRAAKEVNDELRAQADPVFALIEAQNDLRDSSKAYDKAVKEHGKNSREAKDALRAQAEAALDLQGAVGALGDDFDGKLTPAMRSTLRAAGFTKKEINELEKQFNEARKAGNKFEDKYEARVSLDNYRDVNGKLNGLLRDLENFDGSWTATMITNYVKHGKPGTGGGLRTGGIKGAASGGPQGDLTWVGENGPELASLPTGTTVHSAGDSQRMMKQAMSGGASGDIRLIVESGGYGSFEAFLAELIRRYVRVTSGGNVQKAFGD